jgi:hypothetical protein
MFGDHPGINFGSSLGVFSRIFAVFSLESQILSEQNGVAVFLHVFRFFEVN